MRRIALLLALMLCAVPAFAQSEGAVSPGNRAPRSDLTGCTYNSAGVALTDGQQVATQCDASGNQKIGAGTAVIGAVTGAPETRTDRSGTIALGGSAQTLMAVNASRHGCVVQNQSTGDLWVSEISTGAATQPSWWFPAGSYWNCESTGVPTTALSIFGATTGQAFAAREW